MTRASKSEAEAPFASRPLAPESGADRLTLRAVVLESLRTRIVSGDMRPGERLLESEIASQLGTSRGPVRESIRQLEQEGLVEFFPHRGALVVGVPEREMDGVYELRAVIEARAVAAAGRVINRNDMDYLRGVASDWDQALVANDVARLAELDHEFHGYLMNLSGLVVLRRIWDGLDGLVRVGTYQRIRRAGRRQDEQGSRSSPTHQDLLAALDGHDDALAHERIVKHILGDLEPPF